MREKSSVLKSIYFANWADNFGFPIAYKLLPIVLPFKFITPNVITISSFILYALGCLSLFLGYRGHLYFAALLLFAGYIGDDLDGILARARGLSSTLGDYLDKVLDVLKIFLISFSLSFAVFLKTDMPIDLILGFLVCFFFMFRYYIKLETMFTKINSDPRYLQKSHAKKEELTKHFNKMTGLKSLWIRNRTLFFVDEAEFVVVVALGAVFNRLEIALWVLAASQVALAIFRVFERGSQLKNNSEDLLKPLRK